MFGLIWLTIENGLDLYNYLVWLLKQTKNSDLTDTKAVWSLRP